MTRLPHLLVAAAVLWQLGVGLLYAVVTPRWQAPDEPAHFNYARELATTGRLPVLAPGDYDQQYLERLKSERFPAELSIDSVRYEGHQPPAYYALAAIAIRLAGPNLDQQLLAARLVSVLLGGLLILLVFRIAGYLVPNDPWLAALTALVPALIPQHLAVFAAVSNDSLASVSVALTVFLAARLIAQRFREGRMPTNRAGLALGLAFGLVLLSKLTAYTALPVGLLALAISTPRSKIKTWVVALLPPTIVGATWAVRNVLLYGWFDPLGLVRHDAIVVGQPLTGPLTLETVRKVAAIGMQSFWGQFGWMGVLMDNWVYALLWAGTVVASIGGLFWVAEAMRPGSVVDAAGRRVLSLLCLLFALLLLGFVWYNLRYLQPQGRYLFAAMPAIALFFAAGLRTAFSGRAGPALIGLCLGSLALLDLTVPFRYVVPQLTR